MMIHFLFLTLCFLLQCHSPKADVVGDGLLGSGGGKGYLYAMDIPSNEQGILSFASTDYSVHENSMSAIITITRTCNAAQAKLCAGDVSVKYSTETIPNIPLPGTFTVTTGSNIVTPTADLRDLLFNSDQLRIPWEEHRLDPMLTMDHSVTNFNHGQDIQTKERYGANGLRAYTRRVRYSLPGVLAHSISVGATHVVTSRDLRTSVSRGDVLRIGYERFKVAMNGTFNSTHLPLDGTFQGYYPVDRNVTSCAANPPSTTTNSTTETTVLSTIHTTNDTSTVTTTTTNAVDTLDYLALYPISYTSTTTPTVTVETVVTTTNATDSSTNVTSTTTTATESSTVVVHAGHCNNTGGTTLNFPLPSSTGAVYSDFEFPCLSVQNIQRSGNTHALSAGVFTCSVMAEFVYKGVSTFTDHSEHGTPVNVLFKVTRGSKSVTTSGNVEDIIAEGDLLKLETRTYIVDDVSKNNYGTYQLQLKEEFVSGDMDVTYPANQEYIISGFLKRVKIRLPGFACAQPGNPTINTTHDLSGHVSLGDLIKVGGQSSYVINDPIDVQDTTHTPAEQEALYTPGKGSTHTFAHRLLLNRPYQSHREAGCGLSLFTTLSYGSGITGRINVEHNSPWVGTTMDHSREIYRGEVIKIGYVNYIVNSDPGDYEFVGLTLPLKLPGYVGITTAGLIGYRALPNSGTTATKHADYVPKVGTVRMPPYVSSAMIQIAIQDDYIVENINEKITLTLFEPKYEAVRYSTSGLFLDGNVVPLQTTPTTPEQPYQCIQLSVDISGEVQVNDEITILGSSALVESCNGTHVFLQSPYWTPPSGYAEFVGVSTTAHGLPMYKHRPSLGISKATLTILNDDPSEAVTQIVDASSTAAAVDTMFDFNSDSNVTIVTAQDHTNDIFKGDTIILLQHNEGDPLNPIDDESFVSVVNDVARRSITVNASIPYTTTTGGSGGSSTHASNWTNFDMYVGTTPDHPGTIEFKKNVYTSLESDLVHVHDLPLGDVSIKRTEQLPGTGTIDYATTPTVIGTTDDLRRKISAGALLVIDHEERVVTGVTRTEITIKNSFKSATDGSGLQLYRYMNSRRVVVEVERTKGSSGRVAVDFRTCQAGHTSPLCTAPHSHPGYTAIGSDVGGIGGYNWLPGVALVEKAGSTTVRVSRRNDHDDASGLILSDVLLPGESFRLNNEVFTMLKSDASLSSLKNNDVLQLGKSYHMESVASFRSIGQDGHNNMSLTRLTQRLPGLFDAVEGSPLITYNDESVRTLVDQDGPIKIGNEMFQSFHLSKHAPLGVLRYVTLTSEPGSFWLTTNDTDVRVGHVQFLKCRASGGWFTLSFAGITTPSIQWNATVSEVDVALKNVLPAVDFEVTRDSSSPVTTDFMCDATHETVIRIEFKVVPHIYETMPLLVPYGAKLVLAITEDDAVETSAYAPVLVPTTSNAYIGAGRIRITTHLALQRGDYIRVQGHRYRVGECIVFFSLVFTLLLFDCCCTVVLFMLFDCCSSVVLVLF